VPLLHFDLEKSANAVRRNILNSFAFTLHTSSEHSLTDILPSAVPNGVFSGSIIANIVKANGEEKIRKTAEWQLLLSTLALPGCIIGALIVNRLGRRNLSKLLARLVDLELELFADVDF